MSHTPGPWAVQTTETGSQYIDAKGKHDYGNQAVLVVAADCAVHPVADTSANWTCRHAVECEANARLIAAAPDLLEALEAVLAIVPDLPMPVATFDALPIDQARAAIKKAKGL